MSALAVQAAAVGFEIDGHAGAVDGREGHVAAGAGNAHAAALVHAESDRFTEGVSEEDSWHDRKQAAIDRLAAASRDAKIVAMGDKLSNMRAIWRDYQTKGDALWSIFHVKDKASHAWHYRGLAASLSELGDTFAYREFVRLIDEVFPQ